MNIQSDSWYRVTVRIASDLLDPSEIGRALQLRPTFEKRKGEFVDAIADGSRYATNLWGLTYTKDDSVPFEEQLEGLLDQLDQRSSAVRALLASPGVDAELFLGLGYSGPHGGMSLSPPLVRRIANLGFSIQLDLYRSPEAGD